MVKVGVMMKTSASGSKGKGSRRFPGKDGGAGRKRAAAAWQKRATFMKQSLADLPAPHGIISFHGIWDKSSEESIYLLDQAMVEHGIDYFAEKAGERLKWWSRFKIIVNRSRFEDAREIISNLEKRPPKPTDLMDKKINVWWSSVCPRGLSRKDHNHHWEFAHYHESSYQRDDNQDYHAFLFTNSERTVFGIREWLDSDWPQRGLLEKMATKVVQDDDYRKNLISDDPDIPEMWKDR